MPDTRQAIAELLNRHVETISERWGELSDSLVPAEPGYECESDEEGRRRPALLRALLQSLSGAPHRERISYRMSLLERWHHVGLFAADTDPYFDWLAQACGDVLRSAELPEQNAHEAQGVLARELIALRADIRTLEAELLQRRREEALAQLQGVFERVPSAVVMIELSRGYVVAANATAEALAGRSLAELRVTSLWEMLPGLSPEEVAQARARLVDTGHANIEATALETSTGRHMGADLHLSLIRMRGESVALCQILLTDENGTDAVALEMVTRNLQAQVDERERQVARLDAFVDSVLSALPLRLLVLDSGLSVRHANALFCDDRGLPKEEVVGRPIDEVMSEQTLVEAGLRAAMLSALETGKPVRWSAHRSASSQRERVVNIRLDPCTGPDGDPHVVLSLEDVTERQRQLFERAILQHISHALLGELELHKLLHVILTGMTAGGAVGLGFNRAFLFLVDEDEGTLRAEMAVGPENMEQALKIWEEVSQDHKTLQDFVEDYENLPPPDERPLKDLVSRLVFPLANADQLPMAAITSRETIHVLAAELDDRVPALLHELLGTSEFVVAPLVARDKVIGAAIADNRFSQRPISMHSVQLLTALADQAALAIDSARTFRRAKEDAIRLDRALRELQAAQEERLRSAKLAAIGEVTAIVAHEIRSPLSTIGGFARSIARQPEKTERNARHAQIIVDEVARLETILRDLLDFSKPSEPDLRLVSLEPIVQSVGENLQYADEAKGVEVVVEIELGAPEVLADEKQVRQILMNLAMNGLEAMSSQGTLTLGLSHGDGRVEMYVADTGEGIPRERLDQIFDTFYTSKPTGTGLGLALCSKLVNQHGAQMRVESEEGRGSVFTVSFPASADTYHEARAGEPTDAR